MDQKRNPKTQENEAENPTFLQFPLLRISENTRHINSVGGFFTGNDIGFKGGAIHCPVEDHGRGQAIDAQAGDEGGGFPMSPRNGRMETLARLAAAAQPHHVRLGAGFVDEHQPVGLKPRLPIPPAPALRRHVGALLFGRVRRFFYTCTRAHEASC